MLAPLLATPTSDANVRAEHTYALMMVEKSGTSHHLAETTVRALGAFAEPMGLRLLQTETVENTWHQSTSAALAECQGKFPCLMTLAKQVHADAVVLARAMPSQIEPGAVLLQFLVIGGASPRIERKAGVEVATDAEAVVAAQAAFFSIFAQSLPTVGSVEHLRSMATIAQDWQVRLSAAPTKKGPPDAEELKALQDALASLEALLSQVQSEMDDYQRRGPVDAAVPSHPAVDAALP